MELKTSFRRQAAPGRLVGRGRIVHRDGDLVFLEATLSDANDAIVATASATLLVVAVDRVAA
ncbi:MAG TPA: hypothetical protein VIS07_03535 [Candidatus Binatia bacterium]